MKEVPESQLPSATFWGPHGCQLPKLACFYHSETTVLKSGISWKEPSRKERKKKRQETPMKRQAGRDEREQRGGVEAKREQTLEREEGASQFESKKSRGE